MFDYNKLSGENLFLECRIRTFALNFPWTIFGLFREN